MIRVLVVEDDALIALDLAEQLTEAGFEVVGPALSLREGLALLARSPDIDAAVLDIGLGRETSEPIARELQKRRKPFIVLSSYPPNHHPPAFRGARCLLKPAEPGRLVAAIEALVQHA